MIAALPMYDLPELQGANDALWTAVAARLQAAGVAAPAALTRGLALDDIWLAPDLLLAQTCGYPLVTSLAGRVTLVATPCYNAPGCRGPNYRSALIVRAADPARTLDDLRGRRGAVNGPTSNSGMNLLRAEIAPLAGGRAFFGEVVVTGGHVASVEAIAGNRADVAAVDCVTWAHLCRLRPEITSTLRVLGWTADHPGLPLITALQTDARTCAALRQALADVAAAPDLAEIRAELLLTGFETLPLDRYDRVLQAQQDAIDLGYPAVR